MSREGIDRVRRGLSRAIYPMLGVTIGALAGGAWVGAHGGDTGKVHACVIGGGTPTSPNVRIVGANDSCADGQTAVDWNVAGPPGPPGPTGPQGPSPPAQEVTDTIRTLLTQTGIPSAAFREVSASTPRNYDAGKVATVRCPLSHPRAMSGGFKVEPRTVRLLSAASYRIPGGGSLLDPLAPPRPSGWRALAYQYPLSARVRWSVRVFATCITGETG